VPVVWSKIFIAERVPVIVRLAVAVRIALWPGFKAVTFDSRRMRGCESAAERVQLGMLGVTIRPTGDEGWGVGSRVLLHDAGARGPVLSGCAGHASRPPGRDDTPGVGWRALSPELQLAFGPEAGHCRLPAGRERRKGSLLDTDWFAWETTGTVIGAVEASATWPTWPDAASTARRAGTHRRRQARKSGVESNRFLPGAALTGPH
jgi:hypothetical protein